MTEIAKSPRMEAIAKALESEEAKPTPERREIPWKDGRERVTVIGIELDTLLLNHRSHRIRAQIEADPKRDLVERDPESLEAQETIADLLRQTSRFAELKTDLSSDKGQEEPGVITRQGILVNGNRRAVALRDLGKDYIRVMALPKNATESQIAELELRLQVRRDLREEYSFTNNLLFIRDCLDDNWNWKRVARELGYITQFGESKGIAKVRQAERILVTIEELREMSQKRYGYPSFDASQQALEELDEAYEQLKRSDPEGALQLRTARIVGVLSGMGYRELRYVSSDFVDEYLADELGDDDELTLFADELLGGNGDDGEPLAGVDSLLGSSDGSTRGQSGAGLLQWLTQTAGDNNVTFRVHGKNVTVPREGVVESLRTAMEQGADRAKTDARREDLIEQPKKRLEEARNKLRSASSAFRKAKSDPRFDAPRITNLQYVTKKLAKQVESIALEIEKERTRRAGTHADG